MDGGNFQKWERCRQAGSFIISSPGLMHRPQSRDARTYVTGFHKRWHILSRATPAIRWIRYACAGYDKIAGNDRRQEENICLVPFCVFFFFFFRSLLSSLEEYIVARIRFYRFLFNLSREIAKNNHVFFHVVDLLFIQQKSNLCLNWKSENPKIFILYILY